MKVVSLFDGISCAYVAFQKAGIPIETYRAYEINKDAIEISKKNYANIVHCGDVRNLTEKIECDFLIGGSPCTDLSVAKKYRKGLDGDESSLFWEYVRIKQLLQPKWFLLENVASMNKKDRDIITANIGVEPILFDASLVSAQRRQRYFWTNINFTIPLDRGIELRNILETNVDEKYYIDKPIDDKLLIESRGRDYMILVSVGRRLNQDGKRCDDDKSILYRQHLAPKLNQNKSGVLTRIQKDNLIIQNSRLRNLTPIEYERLQGLPDNYTNHISNIKRYKCLANAFNCDVIAHILKYLE